MFFSGDFDDVAIWNRGLSSNEVSQLYQSSTSNGVLAPVQTLVAHWLMNDNAGNQTVVDAEGAHNGSTVSHNTSALSVTGRINRALDFGTIPEHVTFSDDGLPSGASPFSISAWFKTSSAQIWNPIFFLGTATSGQAYWLVLDHQNLGFDAYGYAGILESATSADGVWHHACLTYDGATLRVWKDSSNVVSRTQALSVSLTGTGYIGADSYSGYQFAGSLDDVRVYNFALSSAQVTGLFNNGNGTESDNLSSPTNLNLVVAGQPVTVSMPLPCGYGTSYLSNGTIVTESIVSPVLNVATQYVCSGATVVNNDFTQTSPTNVTLTLTNNARLTWNWQTQYLLATAANGPGSITGGGWVVAGSNVVLTAYSDTNAHFIGWLGDTNGCLVSGSSLTAPMTQARSISASFAETNGISGEIIHYKMNDRSTNTTVVDSLGNFNGTARQNTASLTCTGLLNGALSFNGVSDYIYAPVVIPTNRFSVSIWAKISDLTLSNYAWNQIILFSLGDQYDGNGSMMVAGLGSWYVNHLMAVMSPANNPYAYDNGFYPGTNVWFHYAATYNGSILSTYVNGVLVNATDNGTGQFFGNSGVAPRHLFLGGNFPQSYGSGLHGMLDDTRIFTNVLTAAQVAALFNSGLGTESDVSRSNTLIVTSANGGTMPGSVTVAYGTLVSESVTNSPSTNGGSRSICVGATVVGNDFIQVSPTNLTLVLTNSATLTWLWQTNYLLTATSTGNGSVLGSANGFYGSGSAVSVVAVPAKGWLFVGWSGDAAGDTNKLSLNLTMDQARTVRANFVPVVGSVVVWGDNSGGVCNVSAGLTNVSAISGGGWFSAALLCDRSIRCWGANDSGQCTIPGDISTNVVSITAGDQHALALLTDGTIRAWGLDNYGQSEVPAVCASNVVKAIAGHAFNTVTLGNGTIRSWGRNDYGQLNIPADIANGSTPVAEISPGAYHSIALLSNGTVRCWGLSWYGMCTVPDGLSNVMAVSAGSVHSMALQASGQVVCWGNNDGGQCSVPVDVTNAVAIAAGGSHSMALLQDGKIRCWGDNAQQENVVPSNQLSGAFAISAGFGFNMALVPAIASVSTSTNVNLSVAGAPIAVSTPTPYGYGISILPSGTFVADSVVSPVVNGTTQYVCIGATVASNDFVQVSSTNVTLTLTNNATLTWNWQTQYLLSTTTNGPGRVTAGNWIVAGSNAILTALPDANAQLIGWSGDTNGCLVSGSTLTVPMTQARSITVTFTPITYAPLANGLVLWNRLDSTNAVLQSVVGPDGAMTAGSNVVGRFGNAIELNMQQQFGVTFPADSVTTSVGCLEFWAKMSGFPASQPGGGNPGLIGCGAPGQTAGFFLFFSANDGSMNGGLCLRSSIGSIGTGYFGSWTFASAIGGGNIANWHHYAVAWNADGLPGVGDGTRKAAIFVDGTLTSANGSFQAGRKFLDLPAGSRIGLLNHQGYFSDTRIAYDNLKVWDFAKTDFSDRFNEGTNAVSFSFTVVDARSNASPTSGVYSCMLGSNLSASVVSPISMGTTQFVCTGATLVGNDVASSAITNVTLTLTNDATLTWNWQTHYLLTIVTNGAGVVSGGGWQNAGSNVTLTASPVVNHRFVAWNDGNTNASRTIVMPSSAVTYTASFALVDGAAPVILGGLITNYLQNGLSYRAHIFTNSGMFAFPDAPLNCEVLIVAGGGGSSGDLNGGGGGAGGLIYTNLQLMAGNYSVVVGLGGTGCLYTIGNNGSNSSFGLYTAIGGGAGGCGGGNTSGAANGGSGGGAEGGAVPYCTQFGTGVVSQGHNGGRGGNSGNNGSGGGGGAGAPGQDAYTGHAGKGGDGLAYDISGSMTYYAGGGGGGNWSGNGVGGAGGLGGGGAGSTGHGGDGQPNTGGGGGGTERADRSNGGYGPPYYCGGNGGSGIVIVRYQFGVASLGVLSAHGGTTPGDVSTNFGTVVNEFVVNSPVQAGATQYLCTGGVVVGNDFSVISPTNITLTLTNNATLTWNWQTQYLLATAASGPGHVSAGRWVDADSTVVVTATPEDHANLVGWSGDTNGCVVDGSSLTVPMTQARSITALFAIDNRTLTVLSTNGGAAPGSVSVNWGTEVAEAITNSPVMNGTTQYVCAGAVVVGNDFDLNSPTNVSLTLTNQAVLTWSWTTNYWLATGTNGNGRVSVPTGWQPAGSNVVICAAPGGTSHFVMWSGDTNGCVAAFTSLTVAVSQPRTITAVFASGTTPVISGKVTRDGTSSGVAGVLITFSGSAGTVLTDNSGNYSKVVPYGWSGFATASFASGGFATPSISYSALASSQSGKNYTWTPSPVVSGRVTRDGSSAGVAGVTITFSSSAGTAVTDVSGNYSLTLPYKWSGSATASFTNGGFATSIISYGALTSSQSGKNYTWTPPPVVSGRVTRSGSSAGVAGVTITFSSSAGTAVTDVSGNYSLTLPYKWSGSATASFTNGGFATPTINYSALTSSQSGKNYTWTPPLVVSGRVTRSGSSAGVAGVSITFSGGAGIAVSDVSGNYSLTVPYKWGGTAIASYTNGGFASPSISYSSLTSSQSGKNYVWTPSPTITGRIARNGNSAPVSGLTVMAGNGGGSVVTGTNGYYVLTVPYGWSGVVTPVSGSGGSFAPATRNFSSRVTANQSGQNFTWTAPAANPADKTQGQDSTTTPASGFAAWAAHRGLMGAPGVVFEQIEDNWGSTYGSEYTFGVNWISGTPLVRLLTVDGVLTAEVPVQDSASLLDVLEQVEASSAKGSGLWFPAIGLPLQSQVPANRQWFQAAAGTAAEYRVTIRYQGAQ